jgi:hypothetical protein
MNLKCTMLCLAFAVAACSGEKRKDDDETTASAQTKIAATALSPDDYRKKQRAFADSVLNVTGSAKALVEKLGKGYAVGSTRLRDTLALLAADKKTDCFTVGRKVDPYLAGTVSFWVNISVIGSDIVRVQESKWTSAAGNTVDACLNQAAKDWKFDATFGKPAAYIVQIQFK